uniref:Uncharacterized protein n=1 Tax=Geospiza parvula TaxID=87175 RepID=A0A8U8CE20_GEOPR
RSIVGSPGSPKSIVGSPRSIVGSPRSIVGSPRSIVGSPRSGSPRSIVGSPRSIVGSPRSIVGSPRSIVGSPRQPPPWGSSVPTSAPALSPWPSPAARAELGDDSPRDLAPQAAPSPWPGWVGQQGELLGLGSILPQVLGSRAQGCTAAPRHSQALVVQENAARRGSSRLAPGHRSMAPGHRSTAPGAAWPQVQHGPRCSTAPGHCSTAPGHSAAPGH